MVLHRPSTLDQEVYRSTITSYRQKVTRTVPAEKCGSYYVFSSDYSKNSSPFTSPTKKQPASGCTAENKSCLDNKPLPIVFTWSLCTRQRCKRCILFNLVFANQSIYVLPGPHIARNVRTDLVTL